MNSGHPTASQLQLLAIEGGALLAPSCTLYTHNTICVQEKYMTDPDPNRCRASPSPLIQVETCVPYDRPLQGRLLPLVMGTLARALPEGSLSQLEIPHGKSAAGPSVGSRVTTLRSFWDHSLQLGCAGPLGTASTPCLPSRSRSRHTSAYHTPQMPCNTPTCLQLTTPWIFHSGRYPKPQTFRTRTLCLGPFASVALGGPVEADGMAEVSQQ